MNRDTASLNLDLTEENRHLLDDQGVMIHQLLRDGERREGVLLGSLKIFHNETSDSLQHLRSMVESGNQTDSRIEVNVAELLREVRSANHFDRRKEFRERLF